MTNLKAVVSGAPALVDALERTGAFTKVLSASSTSELKDLVVGPELRGTPKSEIVFIFADTLAETPQLPLQMMVQKLASGNFATFLLELTLKAKQIGGAVPGVGVLPAPMHTNFVLGAVAGMKFAHKVEPCNEPWAWEEIDFSSNVGPRPKAPAVAVDSGFSAPAQSEPKMGGWSKPAVEPTPAFSAPAAFSPVDSGFSAPAKAVEPESAAAPSNGGWGAPPTQPAAETSGWGNPTAPVEPAPSWNEPAAPAAPVSNGWGNPEPASAPEPSWGRAPMAEAAPQAPTQSWGAPTSAPSFPAPQAQPQAGGWGGVSNDAPPVSRSTYQEEPPRSMDSGQGWSQRSDIGGPSARTGSYASQHQGTQRKGQVISIAVSKGGTGKSSLTLNLAAFLALRLRGEGKTVCVIDTNFQQADAGKYLDTYAPTIMNAASDPAMITRERINQVLAHKTDLNLSVLLGPSTPDEGNPQWITARLYKEILALLREEYDYIFIDTPVAEKYHSIFRDFVLPESDFIIVPVTPNTTTLIDTENWLRSAVVAEAHANGAGVPAEKIGIVLNRAQENIDCSEDDVRANLSSWKFLGSIPETDEWKRCNNNFKLVATENYAELDEAFAHVLYEVTDEEILLASFAGAAAPKKGIAAKLFSMILGK